MLSTRSCLTLFNPWTVAHQVPPSLGFPRQEYWSGLPFLPSGGRPHPEIEPAFPALAGGFFITATWEGEKHIITMINMASFLESELKFACGSRGGLCGVVGERYLKSVRQLWHHRGVGAPRNTCREPRHLWLAEAPVCMCVRVCICPVTMLNLTGVLSSWKTAMAKETPSPFCVPETHLKPFFLCNWDRVLDDRPS